MSDEFGDVQAQPGESVKDTATLRRYYEEAERQLGPGAPHFEVVRRALDLWDQAEANSDDSPPPGKTAP